MTKRIDTVRSLMRTADPLPPALAQLTADDAVEDGLTALIAELDNLVADHRFVPRSAVRRSVSRRMGPWLAAAAVCVLAAAGLTVAMRGREGSIPPSQHSTTPTSTTSTATTPTPGPGDSASQQRALMTHAAAQARAAYCEATTTAALQAMIQAYRSSRGPSEADRDGAALAALHARTTAPASPQEVATIWTAHRNVLLNAGAAAAATSIDALCGRI